jgi:hypothetical protein
MGLSGLTQLVQRAKFLVNENSATILTGMGVTGTVTTAYLTGRATFKAAKILEKEQLLLAGESKENTHGPLILTTRGKIRVVWRLYIPPVVVGASTIASIIMANRFASKKIAALTIASGISERALQEYKEKVAQRLGERDTTKIRDEVAQDRINKHPVNSREVILAGTGEVLCYDMLTGRYFQSTVEELKRAENKINHELNNFMNASLSEFYEEVGLPPTPYTDSVGWNANNRLELQFSTVMSVDQRPCIAVYFEQPPVTDYAKFDYT